MKDTINRMSDTVMGFALGCSTFLAIILLSSCASLIYILRSRYNDVDETRLEYITFAIAMTFIIVPLGYLLSTTIAAFVLRRKYLKTSAQIKSAAIISAIMNILSVVIIPLLFYFAVNQLG